MNEEQNSGAEIIVDNDYIAINKEELSDALESIFLALTLCSTACGLIDRSPALLKSNHAIRYLFNLISNASATLEKVCPPDLMPEITENDAKMIIGMIMHNPAMKHGKKGKKDGKQNKRHNH